ncbi:MAG: tetratricopeptide repeat protein [Planctomycetota bacterium]
MPMKSAQPFRPRRALEAGLDAVLDTAERAHERGRHAYAQRLVEQVLALEPLHASAWKLRSRIAESDDRLMDALMCLRRALDAEPDRAAWQHQYGTMCRRAGRLADAASALRTAIRLRPYRADSMIELGMVLVAMGGRDDAEYWAARALQIDPDNREAHALLEFVVGEPQAPEFDAA